MWQRQENPLGLAADRWDDAGEMTGTTRRRAGARWPWLVGAVPVLLLAPAIGLEVANDNLPFDAVSVLFPTVIVAYPTMGALLASRNPHSPIGWLLLTIGFVLGIAAFGDAYARYTLETEPGALPLGTLAAWMQTWPYAVVFVSLALIALLFPTGRVPGPRWRPLLWIIITLGGLAVVATALAPGTMKEASGFDVANPVGIQALGPALEAAAGLGWIGLFIAEAGSVASLVVRHRRSLGEERQQIRWLAFVAMAIVTVLLVALTTALVLGGDRLEKSFLPDVFFGVGLALIGIGVPAAIGTAVLKYRLYDLDLVVKKAVVFAILVIMVMATAGLGSLILGVVLVPRLSDSQPVLLLGGIGLGLLLIPLYRVSKRISERVVFGGRLSPYEALTSFSRRVGDTYAAEDILPRAAAILLESTRGRAAVVWLRAGEQLRPGAVAGEDLAPHPVRAQDGSLPLLPGDHVAEVNHQGELLGALSVSMQSNDPIDKHRRQLVDDLASQAGPVLRNVVLLEDLRESRRRIVAAQDERARKLERDIHDGAQQQLVALAVKLGLAERLVTRNPDQASAMIAEAKAEMNDALEDLRDLARGIYPPLLADQGLAAALGAQARKSSVPVLVDPDGIGRYGQEIEAAVYFCTLEALQNVAKYANAERATVRLAGENGVLTFEVTDDGTGFDPGAASNGSGLQGMADRLAAIGGSLEVRSSPGVGTTVAGRVPLGDGHD